MPIRLMRSRKKDAKNLKASCVIGCPCLRASVFACDCPTRCRCWEPINDDFTPTKFEDDDDRNVQLEWCSWGADMVPCAPGFGGAYYVPGKRAKDRGMYVTCVHNAIFPRHCFLQPLQHPLTCLHVSAISAPAGRGPRMRTGTRAGFGNMSQGPGIRGRRRCALEGSRTRTITIIKRRMYKALYSSVIEHDSRLR